MRILTKLKFRFRNGNGETFISKGQNLIEDAPDWIEKDGMFDLASKDGTLVKLDAAPLVQGSASKPAKADFNPDQINACPDVINDAPKPAPKKAAPKKTATRKK